MHAKTLLWDFDQTLAYRNGMWSQTVLELLLSYGYSAFTLETVRPYLATGFPWHQPETSHAAFFRGVPWWDAMTRHFIEMLRNMGVAPADAETIAKEIRPRYLDISRWQLYPDVLPCLARSKQEGYTSIIVSNHVPELQELADQLGLSPYLSQVFSSAQVGYEKPNPHIFQTALAAAGEGSPAVMVGDQYAADVQGALACGIPAIWIRRENTQAYPYYCSDLEQFFTVLYRLEADRFSVIPK